MGNWQFKAGIDPNEYLGFLKKQRAVYFTQLPEWASVKDNWQSVLCGFYRKDELCGAAHLLIRPLPLGQKLLYSPRGFVTDYSDQQLLSEFTKAIKEYAGKIGAFCVKLDPFVLNEKIETQGGMKDFGQSFEDTVKNLKALGYIHHGFGKGLGDYFQPRFNLAVPLYDETGPIDEKALLKKFSKGARSYIGNFHKNRGVFFERAKPDDDLSEFVRLLSFTEKRQGINLRNADYFQKILNAFKERAVIYYAKIDLDVFIEYIEKQLEKGQNTESNTKAVNEAKAARREKGKIVTLSTGLVIMPPEGGGIRTAEYLYAGTDLTILPNLCTPNGLIYESICDCIKEGCDYYNLGGVDGDFQSPLAIFKLKFAPHVFEFVGEFDLVTNQFMYFCFETLLPFVKKTIKSLAKRKK